MATRTKIEDMQIGDKIICDFSANKSGGVHGASFYNLGNCRNIDAKEINQINPAANTKIKGLISGQEETEGRFNFVMAGWDYKGRRILVADRVLKSNISYQDLNDEGLIFGKRQNTLLLKNECTVQEYLIDAGNYAGRNNAFSKTHGTYNTNAWQSPKAIPPAWVGQKFPIAKKIIGYSIASLSGFIERMPREWTFEASDNGKDWKVLSQEKVGSWVAEKRYFEVPPEKQDYYTYYRLYLKAWYGGHSIISEIEMFEEDEESKKYNFYVRSLKSSVNAFSEGVTKQEYLIDSGHYGSRDRAFDKKHGSYTQYAWQSITPNLPIWVGQKFPNALKVTSYSVASNTDQPIDRAPIKWIFEGSNNGVDWDVLDEQIKPIKEWTRESFLYSIKEEKQGYYTHYRLNVLDKSKNTYILISDLEMYGEFDLADSEYDILTKDFPQMNKNIPCKSILTTTSDNISKRFAGSELINAKITIDNKSNLGFRPILLVEERDIKRYLIYKDGNYKSILKDGNIIDVQINSFEDFKEKGMSSLRNLFISTGVNRPIDVLGDKFEIKAISKENLKLKIKTPPIKAIDKLQNKDIKIFQKANDDIDKFIEIKGKPKPQIVIPKEDIDISSVESVDKINIKTLGNGGNIKLTISGDSGQRWVVNNSGSWQEIELKDIKDAGMDIKRLSSLTKEELAIILKNNTLRIAYYIEYDDVQSDYGIDNLQMQVDMRGVWQKARHYTDYDYEYASNTKLRVYIKQNGTYKINYPS